MFVGLVEGIRGQTLGHEVKFVTHVYVLFLVPRALNWFLWLLLTIGSHPSDLQMKRLSGVGVLHYVAAFLDVLTCTNTADKREIVALPPSLSTAGFELKGSWPVTNTLASCHLCCT